MDIEFIEDKKDLIVIELKNSDETIPNLLRNILWDDKDVDYAAFERKHPYLTNPRIIVKGKNPKKSLKNAIKKSREMLKEAKKQI